MPRVQIVEDVEETLLHNRVRRAVIGAVVEIYERGTTDDAVVYGVASGGSPLAGPFTTDGAGRVIHEDAAQLFADPQSLTIVAVGDGDPITLYPELISADDVGGREIDIGRIVAPTTITPGGAYTDVPGAVVDVPPAGRPAMIHFFAPAVAVTIANRVPQFWLSDGTKAHLIGAPYYELANEAKVLNLWYPLEPPETAKSYQLKVRMQAGASGDVGITAGPADVDLATAPAFLRAFGC